MHPDLSPHLHTDECNDLTMEFKNCNIEHKVLRFVGRCDKAYDRMVHCFHLERKAKRLKNNQEAIQHQALVRQRMLAEMKSDREKGIVN
ncbi:COX assembly mitochondrial protein 2 homolog [Melanaphis sacchari]|uniref:COX assembly mitochondrial protein 2 homolog n=1 Tax=Melanaphis sacchari TaxID=742174 RepID=UPI000DC14222|nr:COX assembly mitochondrial protein 2 homolog [Melanaphis sacchari]